MNIKNISTKLIAFLIMFLATTQMAWAEFDATKFANTSGNWDSFKATGYESGKGTQDAPYIIKTAEQLAYFASQVKSGRNDKNAYIELAANIDLKDHWWTPIGDTNNNTNNAFAGSFNGNGYTISNLVLDWNFNENNGLFATIRGGEIKNINIDNAYISYQGGDFANANNNARRVGIIAGATHGTARFKSIIISNSKINIAKPCNHSRSWIVVSGVIGAIRDGNNTFKDVYSDVNIDLTNLNYTNSGEVRKNLYSTIIGCIDSGSHTLSNVYAAGTMSVNHATNNNTKYYPTVGTINGSGEDKITDYSTCYYDNIPQSDNTAITTSLVKGTQGNENIKNTYVENVNFGSTTPPLSYFQYKNGEMRFMPLKLVSKGVEDHTKTQVTLELQIPDEEKDNFTYALTIDGTPHEMSSTTIKINSESYNRVARLVLTNKSNTSKKYNLSTTIPYSYYGKEMYADSYASGDGSESNPWIIENDLQLAKLAHDATAGINPEGKYFILGNDIDLSKGQWTPIGALVQSYYVRKESFHGSFDGRGKTISNMTLDWNTEENNNAAFGLFAWLWKDAIIKNITIEKARLFNNATSKLVNNRIVGVVAGELYENVVFDNIIVRNSSIIAHNIDTNGKYLIVGGLAGKTENCVNTHIITNFYSDTNIDLSGINVTNSNFYVGGFMGQIQNNSKGIRPTNIFYAGNITVPNTNNNSVGTIIGLEGVTVPDKSTWTYLNDGTNVKNKNGNKLTTDVATFSQSFANVNNNYITDNNKKGFNRWISDGTNLKFASFGYDFNYGHIDHTINQHRYSIDMIGDDIAKYDIKWYKKVGENYVLITDTQSSTAGVCNITTGRTPGLGKAEICIKGGAAIVTELFEIPAEVWTDIYSENFKGSGSSSDPYLINNIGDLGLLAKNVNAGNSYSGKFFQLNTNLDLGFAEWIPIGSLTFDDKKTFKGIFNGNGNTLNGLYLNWTGDMTKSQNYGLFSAIKGQDNSKWAGVTNLIIDGVEMTLEPSGTPSINVRINLGTLVGDVNQYTEISNIIIRNANIKSAKEINFNWKEINYYIGGVIGNVNNSKNYTIQNIVSDASIDLNNIINSWSLRVGGIIGSLDCDEKAYPNLYYVGNTLTKNNNDNSQRIGHIFGIWYNVGKQEHYYANNIANIQSGNAALLPIDGGNGGTSFINKVNQYITDSRQESLLSWSYKAPSEGYPYGFFSFGSFNTDLTLTRTDKDIITATTLAADGSTLTGERYNWYCGPTKGSMVLDNNQHSNTFTLPPFVAGGEVRYYVYAELIDDPNGYESQSHILEIQQIKTELILDSEEVENGKDYNIQIKNNTWDNNVYLKIEYQWKKNDIAIPGRTKATYTYQEQKTDNIATTDKLSCYIKIYRNGVLISEQTLYSSAVIYLCPNDVTIDGNKYSAGNDNNDGLTPETAMKSWNGAYGKLSAGASLRENVIVLIGTSYAQQTHDPNIGGFSITKHLQTDNEEAFSYNEWKEAVNNSNFHRNTTITGKWNGIDYKGKIELSSERQQRGGKHLGIFGNTKFENITFCAMNVPDNVEEYSIIFCQYNTLEMGEGIVMENFSKSPSYNSIDGSNTCSFQIFGGFNNDARFREKDKNIDLASLEESMQTYANGKEGFEIILKSGHYSGICVGGRQPSNLANINGIMGSPNLPIKCKITVDIDQEFNKQHNSLQHNYVADYDCGVIMAGNHEGAMFADVDIVIKSGRVARVINGTLGNIRNYKFYENGIQYTFPNNSYMGRANILLDPENSRFANKDAEGKLTEDRSITDARVIVTELYGGSTGRGFEGWKKVDNPFYGYSSITINGGTFKILPEGNTQTQAIFSGIYGAGAGGVNGIGYGDANDKSHTPDTAIPFWNNPKQEDVMLYGNYATAKDKLVKYKCYNKEDNNFTIVDPIMTNTKIVINGGIFGSITQNIDGIYACGSGYMSTSLWRNDSSIPSEYGGNVYGRKGETIASLTINGGTFYCKHGIFAGGRGTNYYFSENKYGGTASNFKELGKTYGNVELNITGGTFHCSIYGGGYGVADAKEYNTSNIYTLDNMARVYGSSKINISGGIINGNVYGGGDMAVVDNPDKQATSITIGGNAKINGFVFAGGNGRPSKVTDPQNGTQSPEKVGKVIGYTLASISDQSEILNNVFGGGNYGVVTSKSTINVNGGTIYGSVFGGGNEAVVGTDLTDEEKKLTGDALNKVISQWAANNGTIVSLSEKEAIIYGDIFGGGNLASINGNTSVTISAGKFAGEIFGGGKGLLNADNTVNTSADVTGNTFVTLAHDQGGQEEDEEGKKKDNYSINVIWDKMWDSASNSFKHWSTSKELFFDGVRFLNPHNIYGGGKDACIVGTYSNDKKLTEGTGHAVVDVFKGMTPVDLLRTTEWKLSYNDNDNPHFYVFGGGYGANTKVGSTDVTVNVEGEYGEYNNEVDDETEQMAKPYSLSSEDFPVFDNSKGIPNFTVLGVLGGGYAGKVAGNTKVTVDGQTFLHRVYGGGFGDPNATLVTDNTGEVGGNTEVHVMGAHTYGDVFGGGAGVAPKKTGADYTYFVDIASVKGTTKVEVSDNARIYGKVYGGGDMANVGVWENKSGKSTTELKEYYSPTDASKALSSVTTLNQTTGEFESYEAKNYRTFVNIFGGNIFGEVFGGGRGLPREQAPLFYRVGRVDGNTLLHIANKDHFVEPEAIVESSTIVPYVWNRIYGGCEYGTVDGNTLVHIEGGMLGLNIFGGGYGSVPLTDETDKGGTGQSTSSTILDQVLGKKDTEAKGTYANVLGNTKVQIDGGSWIWNKKADINGNVTSWTDAHKKVLTTQEEFVKFMLRCTEAKSIDDVTDPDALRILEMVKSSEATKEFFNFETYSLKKNHNIFGGGNRACYVGTYGYDKDGEQIFYSAWDFNHNPVEGTGKAEVIINHSPLNEMKGRTASGTLITQNMQDWTTLAGICWAIGTGRTPHPQFSVFGAGYGANTKVGTTEVYAQPGARIIKQKDGTPNHESFRYITQTKDMLKYQEYENEMYEAIQKETEDNLKKYYGSHDGKYDSDAKTYLRYRASRMAWSLGAPDFTFTQVHGGGFSGYVIGDTKVESDCQLFARNIFGGGMGAKPYGDLVRIKQAMDARDAKGAETPVDADDKNDLMDFGAVGGNTKVWVKSGYISRNVYGGGAGIESMPLRLNDNDIFVDFPDIARVNGKTEVHIYGETIDQGNNKVERTMIFGSVYGGGDVANVGTEDKVAEPLKITIENFSKTPYSSLVNVRGGTIFSQLFAGGKGRIASECDDYKKLGGIYGNTCIAIDRPQINYPYTGEDPSNPKNLAPAAEGTNPNIIPYIWNRIYAGCQNGTVYGNTLIGVSDGYLCYNMFGGGWGNVYDETAKDNEGKTVPADKRITSADVTGNTNILITGGEVKLTSLWLYDIRAWEASTILNDGTIYSPQYDYEKQKFKINHNIYGGGNVACTVNNTYLTLMKGLLKEHTRTVPGEEQQDFFTSNEWKQVYNKVGSPHFCIFGGGFGPNTNVLNDTHINIDMGSRENESSHEYTPGQSYMHFVPEYTVMDIVGGGYEGKVTGNTHIEGDGGVFCRRVFGGGFYNSVNATNVEIKAIDADDVFGGGLMGDVIESTNIKIGEHNIAANSRFTNNDVYIHGNVYGGNDVSGYINIGINNDGFFEDNGGTGTNINILGGTIGGNVYGAGNGDYLYALDRKGNEKVTVNEQYNVNPDDASSQKLPLVYTVPMRESMPSFKGASDAAKIVNINSWRPLTNKVNITIKGEATDKKVNIHGDVYGGGNSATVQKVQPASNGNAIETVGEINLNIGSHVNIGRVFMGCNGDALFAAEKGNTYLADFRKINGDVTRPDGDLNFGDEIDWLGDPSNKGISTLFLPTENEDRPTVYPHLLDLYFQPVETDIQGRLQWIAPNGTASAEGTGLTDCTIGTFCCGGNRGNMNVYPITAGQKSGNAFEYWFPTGLTITEKIIGGCNNANYELTNGTQKVYHEGGYLLGLAHSDYPFIKLNVNCQFAQPQPESNANEAEGASTPADAYANCNVYGGCYKSGTIRGDITIDLKSDMLRGLQKANLDKANELFAANPQSSAYCVYGAGYGMDSYVYGNTNVKVGEGVPCTAPNDKATEFAATGTSANFVFGGGQQGNVIGVTNVEVFNGHVYKSVTGGSYSGYVWGSTQVKVGYPEYYQVHMTNHKSGRYMLNRTDKNNIDIDDKYNAGPIDGRVPASETIKKSINLITGDIVSKAVYNDISSINNKVEVPIAPAEKDQYFTPVKTKPEDHKLTWDDINIHIGEAVYGGGYSLAQGSSVTANNTTVLKYTDKYNFDHAFMSEEEHIAQLQGLPNGTTAGFGGNTTILIGDDPLANREHITISHQEMKAVSLPEGTDLFGYYYHNGSQYKYISKEDTYEYKSEGVDIDGQKYTEFYEYDSEGGIFGDGHLSYSEGFRSADITGYGFAQHTVNNPKIINTFQRMDILRLEDNCFTLLGARDYATNATNKTPYSIARVGEIQMIANKITLTNGNQLGEKSDLRARNYMGFANNIHYVGAISSNVAFNSNWYDRTGLPGSDANANKSYRDIKQSYIDDYYNVTKSSDNFQKRNDGTAKNMIGIASGYALKIQGVQELRAYVPPTPATLDDTAEEGDQEQPSQDVNTDKIIDNLYYGPIYGVIEMNLIDCREDEGGGYVYADNIHHRAEGDTHAVDFLETTGNFVFPYTPSDGRYIVDDCFPAGYDATKDDATGIPESEAHYWYVTGFNYYYNAHITGYTANSSSSSPLYFYSDNEDKLTVLSGLKPGQEVKLHSWKTRSGHPEGFSSDLEVRNFDTDAKDAANIAGKVNGGYVLRLGAANSTTYDGENGFRALLPLNSNTPTVNENENTLPAVFEGGDAKITFQLEDRVNNTTNDYFQKHLSRPTLATLVLTAPAYEDESKEKRLKGYATATEFFTLDPDDNANYIKVEEGTTLNESTAYYIKNRVTGVPSLVSLSDIYTKNQDGSYEQAQTVTVGPGNTYYCHIDRNYTYTIYLTIDYVQGPDITGEITVENCALPGEMVRVKKDKVVIDADQSFAATGYYWRIGKREKDADGQWQFVDTTPWTIGGNATGYDSYHQGDAIGKGLFEKCFYNNTQDYLDIPAYYFMNGYGIQLGVTMNGIYENDGKTPRIFPVSMTDGSQFTVHNYHQMDPHAAGVNLHLGQAMARAKHETNFAEPRIYLADQNDLLAFVQFVDTIGTAQQTVKIGTESVEVPRWGKHAQFVVQKNLSVVNPDFDGSSISEFAGTIHGNGFVLSGLKPGNCLVNRVTGNIYNLGLSSGKISNMNPSSGKIEAYHCCFEYNPEKTTNGISTPVVYRIDGTRITSYTRDDFKYGKVAYDLNQFYLDKRHTSLKPSEASMAQQYVEDYFRNGDYQYARQSDKITGENTGITFLREGPLDAHPNYGEAITFHDTDHTCDAPRAQADGTFAPLFFSASHSGDEKLTEQMQDYIFWGQPLQAEPTAYPEAIASRQVSFMTNRVYRTAGYYGDTNISTFHYNAYNPGTNNTMDTYVHIPTTTAIDFTCHGDLTPQAGYAEGGSIFYAPIADNASFFRGLIAKEDVTQNLLVYTQANDSQSDKDIYDMAASALTYDKNTLEYRIKGHHVVQSATAPATYSAKYLHLVERTADDKDSRGDACHNNDFCAPVEFTVTDQAWYTRKPLYYAEQSNTAWEGICLPFTVHKAVASLNGEITHFYGTAPADATAATNHWNLHHEYWLRGLTAVASDEATFQRPGSSLFDDATETMNYTFNNQFFTETYGNKNYNFKVNSHYAEPHTWDDYLPLTSGVPYIMSLPGKRFYEFDLSSKFYNEILNKSASAQNVTFYAYGENSSEPNSGTVLIPVTSPIATTKNGYAHEGTFAAIADDATIHGMNAEGTGFSVVENSVMPFRTYMKATSQNAKSAPAIIRIAETRGIDVIEPEGSQQQIDQQPNGDYLIVSPAGKQRIRIESTFTTTLKVITPSGQLYRLLDVRPGNATYSGFQPGIYLVGKTKVRVE